jgi:hypothetical protein
MKPVNAKISAQKGWNRSNGCLAGARRKTRQQFVTGQTNVKLLAVSCSNTVEVQLEKVLA